MELKFISRWLTYITICIALQVNAEVADRQVAITIDDLPRGGDSSERSLEAVREMTRKLLLPLHAQQIPFAGFVNEGRNVDFGPDGMREILELWLDAGADLGNHTYSHPNINNVSLAEYTADIIKGEPILKTVLAARGSNLEYFRHPFLRTGPTLEIKSGMQSFLDAHGYTVVPVTLDNADYLLAALYTRPAYRGRIREEYVPYMESIVTFFEKRSVEIMGREIPQILLIHANQLNADLMPQLLSMFRKRGYRFVSVDEAMKDDAYQSKDGLVSSRGISWIHRWGKTRGLEIEWEPDPPAWAIDAFRN